MHFDPRHWSKAGFDLYPIFVPHDGFAAEEWEAVFAKTEELAQLVVAAVNACDIWLDQGWAPWACKPG